ncbi:hypothetical protein SynNOUM97013_01746 [Synechococcus sp. NOUM97013]|nr:hypothetical protein SynNOUM97013_01746 [Synechococcus sp. NOUM97013]
MRSPIWVVQGDSRLEPTQAAGLLTATLEEFKAFAMTAIAGGWDFQKGC